MFVFVYFWFSSDIAFAVLIALRYCEVLFKRYTHSRLVFLLFDVKNRLYYIFSINDHVFVRAQSEKVTIFSCIIRSGKWYGSHDWVYNWLKNANFQKLITCSLIKLYLVTFINACMNNDVIRISSDIGYTLDRLTTDLKLKPTLSM